MSESAVAQWLQDIEEIKRLKARYFRLMDTKDWDGFRAIFATDVRIDVSRDGSAGGECRL